MVYNEILRYFPKRIENVISEYIKLTNEENKIKS